MIVDDSGVNTGAFDANEIVSDPTVIPRHRPHNGSNHRWDMGHCDRERFGS